MACAHKSRYLAQLLLRKVKVLKSNHCVKIVYCPQTCSPAAQVEHRSEDRCTARAHNGGARRFESGLNDSAAARWNTVKSVICHMLHWRVCMSMGAMLHYISEFPALTWLSNSINKKHRPINGHKRICLSFINSCCLLTHLSCRATEGIHTWAMFPP